MPPAAVPPAAVPPAAVPPAAPPAAGAPGLDPPAAAPVGATEVGAVGVVESPPKISGNPFGEEPKMTTFELLDSASLSVASIPRIFT